MKTLREYFPTSFDHSPAVFRDMQDKGSWLVAPCRRNRDSDALQRANFDSQMKSLEGCEADFEVCSFGHWACGWYEIVVVRPDTHAAHVAVDLEDALEQYPALNEMLWSQYEYEDEMHID